MARDDNQDRDKLNEDLRSATGQMRDDSSSGQTNDPTQLGQKGGKAYHQNEQNNLGEQTGVRDEDVLDDEN